MCVCVCVCVWVCTSAAVVALVVEVVVEVTNHVSDRLLASLRVQSVLYRLGCFHQIVDVDARPVAEQINRIEIKRGVAPGAARRYAAPADGSSIQKSLRIYVRPRTGPQSAHLWWPAVAKLQRAYRLGSCAMQPACL